jgi:hypothetical protein
MIMKTKLMLAALALLMTSGAAFGAADVWTRSTPQLDAAETTTLANFAGSQKHNRCPRFKVIDAATKAELAAANMTGPSGTPDDPTDDLLRPEQCEWKSTSGPTCTAGTSFYADEYATDPSAFCKKAWEMLGPNGTYKRQMLEAK